MKIAVCLIGQMRTFESCSDSILNNLVAPLNADLFIHTSTISAPAIPNTQGIRFPHKFDKNPKELLINKFGEKIKFLYIEENEPTEHTNKFMRKKQWMRLSECLKHITEDYGIIIKTRLDLSIKSPPNVSNIKNNTIYINSHFDKKCIIHDQFLMGNNETMKKLIPFPDNFSEKLKSEIQLNNFLKQNNINMDTSKGFKWEMIR